LSAIGSFDALRLIAVDPSSKPIRFQDRLTPQALA
jgi:hypothetical protein